MLREAPAPGTAGEGDPLEALLEELDLASVAEIVGAGVGAVKVRLHRARRKLRQWLAADAAEPDRPWSETRRG